MASVNGKGQLRNKAKNVINFHVFTQRYVTVEKHHVPVLSSLEITLQYSSTRMGTIEVTSPYYLLSTCLVLSFTASFVALAPEYKSVVNCR
jgi:glyoxylate utilization-related uncharacterized protein